MSTKKKKQSTPTIGDIRHKSRELGVVRGRVSRSFDTPRILEIKRIEDTILRSKDGVTQLTVKSGKEITSKKN